MAVNDPNTEENVGAAQAPAGETQIARLFELTSDLLATVSPDGRFTLLNPAWQQLLGWSLQELAARQLRELVHPDELEHTVEVMLDSAAAASELQNVTTRYLHRDGSWRWLLWSARRDGGSWYVAAKDVTERVWLERQALHDPLTRLPNRVLLMDRARQALARLHRRDGLVAMLFIDLDRFKAVNDNLGHEVGDRLLQAVSERLAMLMRDSDTVARLGGDEFVVLAADMEGDGEPFALAERIISSLCDPFRLGSTEVAIVASVGISLAHRPDADPETMLREADVAMYRAKAEGGRRAELFDDSLRQEMSASVELESRLRHALPQHELELAFQPILRLAGGQPLGCEALVRWRPRDVGADLSSTVLPSTFLPPAADSDLIVQIGNWVLHAACAQAEIWRRSGITVPVSVNISARELTELDLAERVREELAYCRLPGRALCLDVSEEDVIRDPERARAALADIKRLGVAVALDNFGADELAMRLPGSLPLDFVKLDRGLTASFHENKGRRAMFAATVALAKEAGVTAVAVGIESYQQLALARQLDCMAGQGFLLHEPAPPDQVRLRGAVSAAVTSPPWNPLVRLRGTSYRR